jgi:hypothetical protein
MDTTTFAAIMGWLFVAAIIAGVIYNVILASVVFIEVKSWVKEWWGR